MKYKPNQRVAYYEVTGLSDPSPAKGVEVGSVLIDRPRGEFTSWDFMDMGTGQTGWISGKRLGFARVDAEGVTSVPEPKLQKVLDDRKDELK